MSNTQELVNLIAAQAGEENIMIPMELAVNLAVDQYRFEQIRKLVRTETDAEGTKPMGEIQ